MKRLNWAGLAVTGLLSVTALSGCSSDPAPGGSEPPPGVQLKPPDYFVALTGADAAPGATAAPAAFSRNICNSCHGDQAQGNPPFGPEIRHMDPTYGSWVVRNGRGADSSMIAFPATSVTDAELAEIMTWLNSLPKPTTPVSLYKDFCGNCHGPNTPTGGAVPVAIGGLASISVSTFVRGGSGSDPALRTGFMPKFDMTRLTDPELAQIQSFLGSK
jgi:mono/diheme cytochrome c family protein